MEIDVANLTPEAHEALVECLKIAARRGRMLREARERELSADCAQSSNNNATEETEKQLSLDRSQQTTDDQQNRCPPPSDEPVIDLAINGIKANTE